MTALLQDIRFGLRMLAKNPGFTAVAVMTLALGIGANSTIFSWINSTLLDPIPGVADTSEIVSIMRGERSEHPTPPFSYPDYADLRAGVHSMSGLLAYHEDFLSLTGNGKPERIYGAFVSANYFDFLRVRPILGRGFSLTEEEKPGGTPAVVISYALWQNRFGADPSVIGKPLQINKRLCTIVGVAPPGFVGCVPGTRSDLWMALVYSEDHFRRDNFWLNVLGRLEPGVERRQAEAELDLQMRQIVQRFPDTHRGPNQITLDPLYRSPFGANIYMYKTLPMLLALAVVLLLLGCANVANLLLVRSVSRRRELALRLAMGAGRPRLMRQLLVESLLLALLGGGVAIIITSWTAGTLAAFFPPTANLSLRINGQADHTVFAVTILISILTAMLFGTLPALRSSALAPAAVLKEEAGTMSGGTQKLRISSALVMAQISLSLLLLICAGLFIRSLQNAQDQDPGFDPNHVLLASYELGPAGYSAAQGIAFHRQVLSKLEALPGIESVTLADFSPLSFTLHSNIVQVEGYVPQPGESMEIDRANVGPNYFRTMRTAIIAGREFTAQDGEKSQPVAIVNQQFADRYWPGQDALGKRVYVWGRWHTVVGVARNGKYRRLIYPPAPAVFLPLFQDYSQLVMIHARVSGHPQADAAAVEGAVHGLNADLPVFGVTTLKSSMLFGSIFERVAGTFAGAFGLLALILAAVGIYGVVAYTTRQRTHEIAIRMALGARRVDVFRLVLGQVLLLTVGGLAVGIAASLVLTRYLRSVLYGVTTSDLWTYAAVTLLLGLVSLAACYIPARQATKIDPMAVLKYE
jgi:putative ABC transport system permease protein